MASVAPYLRLNMSGERYIKCGMLELKIKDDPTNEESKRCSVSGKEYQDREEKEQTESG